MSLAVFYIICIVKKAIKAFIIGECLKKQGFTNSNGFSTPRKICFFCYAKKTFSNFQHDHEVAPQVGT